jgi:hypothetical protein
MSWFGMGNYKSIDQLYTILTCEDYYTAFQYAKIYLNEIVSLHDMSISTISRNMAQLTVPFWKSTRIENPFES